MATLRVIKELQNYYRQPQNLSHAQRVTRLYRASLRTLDSWAVSRDLFNKRSEELRTRFDTNKRADVGLAARLLREGEEELAQWTHPDIYVLPYMPGGSKFMRNPPPPLNAVYPDGVPADANIATKDLNNIQLPLSANPKGAETTLVDFSKKTAE